MMEGKHRDNFRSRNSLIHIHNSYHNFYYLSSIIFMRFIFLIFLMRKKQALKNKNWSLEVSIIL